jgi:hypothetical protein
MWILLQVADVLFPALGIPDSAKLYVLLAGLICFPISIVFGWRYDITSQGIVRTKPTDADESHNLSLQKADYLTLLALAFVIVAVGLGIGGEIMRSQAPGPGSVTDSFIPEKSSPSRI